MEMLQTLQSPRDRLARCSSWHLRFVVYSSGDNFKWRQFEPGVILLAVGWYLRFSLSYRDVEELLTERGLHADHVTVWRWVQRCAPELQRVLRRHLKPTNDSWRMDETYVRVKGKWRYLFRAVDSTGGTLDFLLSAKQTILDASNAVIGLATEGHSKRLFSTKRLGEKPQLISAADEMAQVQYVVNGVLGTANLAST
jgi:transposase-like protein